jgi:hypothetical protein
MFNDIGFLTKLGDVSDAHARAGHPHPCDSRGPQEVLFDSMPKVGERWEFVLDGRVCATSHVKERSTSWPAKCLMEIVFSTSNSKYKLELDIADFIG